MADLVLVLVLAAVLGLPASVTLGAEASSLEDAATATCHDRELALTTLELLRTTGRESEGDSPADEATCSLLREIRDRCPETFALARRFADDREACDLDDSSRPRLSALYVALGFQLCQQRAFSKSTFPRCMDWFSDLGEEGRRDELILALWINRIAEFSEPTLCPEEIRTRVIAKIGDPADDLYCLPGVRYPSIPDQGRSSTLETFDGTHHSAEECDLRQVETLVFSLGERDGLPVLSRRIAIEELGLQCVSPHHGGKVDQHPLRGRR